MAAFKIKTPVGSRKSGNHVPVVIVAVDANGEEVEGTEENAIMRPDGSIGPERFPTPQAAAEECERRNAVQPN